MSTTSRSAASIAAAASHAALGRRRLRARVSDAHHLGAISSTPRDYSTGAQQAIYLVVKVIQFAFPRGVGCARAARAAANWPADAQRHCCWAPRSASWSSAPAGCCSISCCATRPFSPTAAELIQRQDRQTSASIRLWKYVVLAVFYSLFHSLLEEYYWRWFVFRQLRRLVPLWPAIVISALGVHGPPRHRARRVLSSERRGSPRCLSAAVAVGGAFWAWLYDRTGSLFGPWLSHLLIDAGIFLGRLRARARTRSCAS